MFKSFAIAVAAILALTNSAAAMWDREMSVEGTAMNENYQPSGDFTNYIDGRHDQDMSNSQAFNRRARTRTDSNAITIDLIWNSDADLDLHVFEPTAINNGKAMPLAKGHVWSKAAARQSSAAAGQIRDAGYSASHQVSAERYTGSRSGADAFQLYLSVADMGSGDCQRNLYALNIQLRIKTNAGVQTVPVDVRSIDCGSSRLFPIAHF